MVRLRRRSILPAHSAAESSACAANVTNKHPVNRFTRVREPPAMNRILPCLSTLVLMAVPGRADLLLEEPFAYPDGRLAEASGGLWTIHSGSLPLNVEAGRVTLDQADGTSGREDAHRLLAQTFDPVADNVTRLYAAFTVNFTALPFDGGSSTAGSYFAHFKASAANQFYARIGAQTEGALPGTFRLAVANADWGASSSVPFPQDLSLGVTYEVAVRLDLATDQTTLWVHPTDEGSLAVTATDPISYSGVINAFAVRQGTTGSSPNLGGPGTLTLGDLRVATTFAGVRAVPEPNSAALLILGAAGLMGVRRRGTANRDRSRRDTSPTRKPATLAPEIP
jgi:hypothetical protein